MKRHCFFLLLVSYCVACIAHSRTVELFNREWRFCLGDIPEASQSHYDDHQWELLGLPHSFSIPYFMAKDFYVGTGWYRKHLSITEEELAQCISLEFDGAFLQTDVFVNGKLAGSHTGGYTGFSINLTKALRAGDNVIAIRVDNRWRADVAPRAGEHTFSGGIYRSVRLVKKQPLHIGWCGVGVTTPLLASHNGRSSDVVATIDLHNRTSQDADCRIVCTVRDAQGHAVCQAEEQRLLPADRQTQVSIHTPIIAQPHLWSPASPCLYTLHTAVYHGDRRVDEECTPFGFRWIEWTKDKGFFLNGQHTPLRGANVHQDEAGWGDAMTAAGMGRDVRMMKEAGMNFIRGSHYPHAPQFSDACDTEGVMLWSECPFWGIGGFEADGYWNASAYPVADADTAGFHANVRQQLKEMVLIHRNHPSIIAWSMCNEVFFSRADRMEGVRHLLQQMVDDCHRLDPTRPAAIGGSQRPLGEHRIDLIGDIAGYNGDGARLPDFQCPPVASVVSEYGSVTADRPGDYHPGWGDLTVNEGWKGYDWRSGHAVWCGFDHGSIAGSTLGKMGIVDYFRIPKRAWFWYRNTYSHIAPPEWPSSGSPAKVILSASKKEGIRTDGTDDTRLRISLTDNAGHPVSAAVETTVRIISGPGQFPTGKSICFRPGHDIRILDGQASISIRSYYSGTTCITATGKGLAPDTLFLQFVGDAPYAPSSAGEVKERSYRPYSRNVTLVQEFGFNNPAFASSATEGHPASMVTTSSTGEYWEAAASDARPWLTLDTEKGLELEEVSLRFFGQSPRKLTIETSIDGQKWTPLKDLRTSQEAFRLPVPGSSPCRCRFIRLSFLEGRPSVSLFRVRGKVTF